MAAAVKILKGLKILLRYDPQVECDAQHDVLLAGGPRPDKLGEEDRKELSDLGWSYDVHEEAWRKFT